ncbi:MAG: hypothetical protein ACKV0T_25315 [Planctomycetales bacterium]
MSQSVTHLAFPVPWIGIGVFVLLIALAGVIVLSVLIASRHSLTIWRRIKSALGVLVWIVPAAGVIALVGIRTGRQMEVSVSQPLAANEFVSDRSLPAEAADQFSVAPLGRTSPAEMEFRLHVRKVASDEPEWVKGASMIDGRPQVVVSSERFVTLAEAEHQVTQWALFRVREHFQHDFPGWNVWPAAIPILDQHAVRDLVAEVRDKDFGNGVNAKIYRAHLRLDFTPKLRDSLSVAWRESLASRRLTAMGGVLGLTTLMLGTAAGYFRLDLLTAGLYRRRLKLAALAVVAAASLAAMAVVG